MKDRIKIKSSWSAYENKVPDTNQEGIESEIKFFRKNQSLLLFLILQKVELQLRDQTHEDQTYLMELIILKNLT